MNTNENKNHAIETLFDEHTSNTSFDFLNLFTKVAQYWYLFLIGLILALILSYIKKKQWTPTYKSATTILLENNRSTLRSELTSGYSFGGGSNNLNFNNQMVLYNSYDFISNTVDKLNLTSEIYKKTRFQTQVLYDNAPISIETKYVSNIAYGLEFFIKGINENTYEISFAGNKKLPAFRQQGKYGLPFRHVLFFLIINKTSLLTDIKYDLNFHLFKKTSLIENYRNRLASKPVLENASVIEISLDGKVVQRDVDFLNLLNEQYFQENLGRKNAAIDRSIQFIDDQIAILQDSIESSEQKLNLYQMVTGIYSTNQLGTRAQSVDVLEKHRHDIRLKKQYLLSLSNYLNKNTYELLTDPSTFQMPNSQLSVYVQQYNSLILNMKMLGDSNPIYASNLEAMDDLQHSIREAIKVMNNTIALEEKENDRQYEKAVAELEKMPQQERQLSNHERDFKVNDTYYTYLLQRRTENQIQRASNTPDNYIIDKPRVLYITNLNDISQTYLIYILVCLLIPAIFVFFKEFVLKITVQSQKDLEALTKYPLLGTIEQSKDKELFVVKAHSRSSLTEGFRTLRSRIEYMVKKERPVSMLMTSTESQEGKTFIALNLSSIYQMGDKKVILVDMDLRRPALSRAFNLEQRKGLSNCLIGQVPLQNAIVSVEKNLDILPAGTIPPNPSELIRMEKNKEILKTLYQTYDYVILDCGPVGLVSDAHYLASLVDIVLYVVRDGKTNKEFLRYTLQEFQQDGISNVALVYNDINVRRGRYGKGYYYTRNSYYQSE